jgi:hypothetical protein
MIRVDGRPHGGSVWNGRPARTSIDHGNQAERVARQQSLPGAVGNEVKFLQHECPDQSVGASRFDDHGEDTGAALDLDLNVIDNRLGLRRPTANLT